MSSVKLTYGREEGGEEGEGARSDGGEKAWSSRKCRAWAVQGSRKGVGGGCGEAPDCLTKAINPEGLSGGPANPSLGSNLPVPSQASYFQQQ